MAHRMTTPTAPAWLALADTLLNHLATARTPDISYDDEIAAAAPFHERPKARGLAANLQRIARAEAFPPETSEAPTASSEVPNDLSQVGKTAEPLPPPLHFFEGLAAVRLARTLEEDACLARLAAPRALHVFETSDSLVLDYVQQLLRHAFRGGSAGGQQGEAGQQIPRIQRYPSRERDQQAWAEKFQISLGGADPIVILATSAEDLPPEAKDSATAILSLAPLTCDGVLFLLERTHSVTGDVALADLRCRMPSGSFLARLPALTLAAAFRAQNSFEVIERLRAACQPPIPTGDLELLEGMGNLESAARDLVNDMVAHQSGRTAWRDMTRSLLLHGAPGCGKTFAARVIADAAGAQLFTASLGVWQARGHLGDLLKAMRAAFAEARAASPSILFVDEVDGFGTRATDGDHNKNYRRQVVNEFLNQLNGLQEAEGCVVIAATNDLSALDPAIIRPGRFDQIVEVGLPGPKSVAAMLRHHLRGDLGATEVDALAVQARGQTAAEIEAAVRRARGAARRDGVALTRQHLARALSPSTEIPEDLSWRIAIHEAGHALVGAHLRVGQIRAIRLTPQGGLTEIVLRQSAGLPQDIEDALAYQLAGRAAERLVFGVAGSGSGGPAHSDLGRATEAALEAELSLGAGATGLVWLAADPRHLANPELRARISDRLDAAEARAHALLSDARETLHALARALLRERVIEGWALQLMLTLEPEDQEDGDRRATGTDTSSKQPISEEAQEVFPANTQS
ncbi:AAA family ATPase [Acidimangrovimonas sediminis]|uniref:AAA family ATPase n=1 Tax=Acidimangrovimonas sediminis TaxID=2056283 RepID=UPI000C80CEA5|nr:AAA family ATPase [Acidimangrovimonas sediminis]